MKKTVEYYVRQFLGLPTRGRIVVANESAAKSCRCSIRVGDVDAVGRLKHRADCGQPVEMMQAPQLGGLRVNGKKLGGLLANFLVEDADLPALKRECCNEWGIDAATLDAMRAGRVDVVPRAALESIAAVLSMSLTDLLVATDADVSAYRQPALMVNARAENSGVPEPPKFLTGPPILGGVRLNGGKLAAILSQMIADQADGDAEGLKARIAAAAGMDASTLASLLEGKIDFPKRSWVESIASTLGVSAYSLFQRSDAEVSAYRPLPVMANVRAQDSGVPDPPKFLTRPL